MNPHDFLTVSDVAKAFGVRPGRVNYMIRVGQLAACKVSRLWLVDRASFDALAQKRKGKGLQGGDGAAHSDDQA